MNKKGYNNPSDWEKVENMTSKNEPIKIEAEEIIEAEEVIPGFEAQKAEDNQGGEFDEVLTLTQFNDNPTDIVTNDNPGIVAEYREINTVEIATKHKKQAKSFVNKITKFILDFDDIDLTTEQQSYLKSVGAMQIEHLQDLLELVDVNKQMLNNIIARVNVTQAEDYSILNTYNNLANQHLKFIKELQNTYKAIPAVLKKMRTEVVCNQELGEGKGDGSEVMGEDYGDTQFNDTKALLRQLVEEEEAKDELND
jgi:hypothetical protein